jgi:hypothetical protein
MTAFIAIFIRVEISYSHGTFIRLSRYFFHKNPLIA